MLKVIKSRVFILITLVIVLIVGLGAGYYFYTDNKADEKKEQEASLVEDETRYYIPEEDALCNLIINNFENIDELAVKQSFKEKEGLYRLKAIVTLKNKKDEEHNFTIRIKDNKYTIIDEEKTLKPGRSEGVKLGDQVIE